MIKQIDRYRSFRLHSITCRQTSILEKDGKKAGPIRIYDPTYYSNSRNLLKKLKGSYAKEEWS